MAQGRHEQSQIFITESHSVRLSDGLIDDVNLPIARCMHHKLDHVTSDSHVYLYIRSHFLSSSGDLERRELPRIPPTQPRPCCPFVYIQRGTRTHEFILHLHIKVLYHHSVGLVLNITVRIFANYIVLSGSRVQWTPPKNGKQQT